MASVWEVDDARPGRPAGWSAVAPGFSLRESVPAVPRPLWAELSQGSSQ